MVWVGCGRCGCDADVKQAQGPGPAAAAERARGERAVYRLAVRGKGAGTAGTVGAAEQRGYAHDAMVLYKQ